MCSAVRQELLTVSAPLAAAGSVGSNEELFVRKRLNSSTCYRFRLWQLLLLLLHDIPWVVSSDWSEGGGLTV